MSAKAAAPTLSSRPVRKKLPAHWLPRQHGAWAMLFLPFIVGAVLRAQEGRLEWVALPLLLLWLLGYFAFNALTLWLKSGRQARYVPPLQVYGAMCAVLGAVVLLLKPALLSWGVLYAPLLGVGLWRAARKDDTSLLARWVSVLAACLICAVVYSEGLTAFFAQLGSDPRHARAARATLILSGYFLGTVLYVKTMIREKGEAGYIAASVSFHAALVALSLWAARWVGGGIPTFFALTALRSALLPWLMLRRGRKVTPKHVGLLEFGLSFTLLLLIVR